MDHEVIPGMFLMGDLVVEEKTVSVAIETSALQLFRDWDMIFCKEGEVDEVVPVERGLEDGEWVEFTSGLEVGSQYVSANSYLIKADIPKSGTSHDH